MTGVVSDRSDAELLAAHVAGESEAFGELFARHRDRLWAVALRTMGNPEDAADGLQDAMVSAFRRAETFQGGSAVTTWLHRVVVNACLDRLRAAKVRAHDSLPDDAEQWHEPRGAVAPAAAVDPAEASVTADRRQTLLAALAELPAEQRAALVLVDMEGYSVAEAAEMLECAVGTVKSRCARGRSKLAARLGMLGLGPASDATGNPTPTSSVSSTTQERGPPSTPA